MDDNAYLDTIKDINWDTFYQQKMALESLIRYLHRNKEQENGMFGRAAAWMEGIDHDGRVHGCCCRRERVQLSRP